MRSFILIAIAIAIVAIFFGCVQDADAHGWRHGKSLGRAEIREHPNWLRMPGHTCNRDFAGDIYTDFDDELGWVIIWRCTCRPHPNGVSYICWWRIERILPENASNRRILRAMRDVMNGRDYTRPRLVVWPGGEVFRKHYPGAECHWHNDRNEAAIIARRQ